MEERRRVAAGQLCSEYKCWTFGAVQKHRRRRLRLEWVEDVPGNEGEVRKHFGQSFLWNVTESRALWECDDDAGIFPTASWKKKPTQISKCPRCHPVGCWGLTWEVSHLLLYIASHFLHAQGGGDLWEPINKIKWTQLDNYRCGIQQSLAKWVKKTVNRNNSRSQNSIHIGMFKTDKVAQSLYLNK